MKQSFIIAILLGLFVSCSALSQDETVDSAQSDERNAKGNRGDKDDDNRRNNRNNNNLSRKAIRIIDTDEDGQVSIEEYMTHAQQRFSDLDLDDNNFVTAAEAKEAAEIMRESQKEARSTLDRRKNNSRSESASE